MHDKHFTGLMFNNLSTIEQVDSKTFRQCHVTCNAQRMKFSIKDLVSKFDQIRNFLRIWSHLLKKSLMENFIFCAVLLMLNVKHVAK